MYKGKYLAAPGSPAAKRPSPRKAAKKKKRVSVGSIIFWIFYLLLVAAICGGIYYGLQLLEPWLADYEASQPDVKCQEVFDSLFADRDWGEIYTLAGMDDTQFETKENYVAYMENKAQGKEVTFYETSAGLSGDHKYIVKLGDEKIAVFTLTGEEQAATQIPQWELGAVEVFIERLEDVTICTAPDRLVYINGKALSDDYTVRTAQTLAEEYLPLDVHGLRMRWQYVDGLLTHPQVSVTDQAGNPVELQYDEATNTYSETFPVAEVTSDETQTVHNAAKAYCRFMIGANTENTLRLYFDETSAIFKTIMRNDRSWMQSYNSYNFSEPTVSSYYRYSDTLYSLRLTMTLNVVRGNGTVKEFPLDSTFFVEKKGSKWLVVDMTNVEVQEITEFVRLTFMQGDTLVHEEMVDTSEKQLMLPEVIVPEGQIFIGWYRQSSDENGNKTMTQVFEATQGGAVYLSGVTLEPMTLYALFEAEETA